MKKKIIIISILAVFILVAITYVSAVNANTTDTENKESPLWIIRTKSAIGEKISKISSIIKTRFLGERIFYPSLRLLSRFLKNNEQIFPESVWKCEQASPITEQIGCDTVWKC